MTRTLAAAGGSVAMVYTVAALSAVWVGGTCLSFPAYAGPNDVEVVNGICEPSSHTAEGPLGSDLTKRQSRFYCDSAVITYFDDRKGHVMIQFAQKESHHSPILGFAGRVEDDGIMMPVDHVSLAPGQATAVSDGWCKFFFKDRHMSGIFCGMKVDETGRRTTAVVAFTPTPRQ
jgi:hypothetical protein